MKRLDTVELDTREIFRIIIDYLEQKHNRKVMHADIDIVNHNDKKFRSLYHYENLCFVAEFKDEKDTK